MVEYKNKVLFMYKSKEGKHLYAFLPKGGIDENVVSVLINISDLIPVMEGKNDWCKVSLMPKKEDDGN